MSVIINLKNCFNKLLRFCFNKLLMFLLFLINYLINYVLNKVWTIYIQLIIFSFCIFLSCIFGTLISLYMLISYIYINAPIYYRFFVDIILYQYNFSAIISLSKPHLFLQNTICYYYNIYTLDDSIVFTYLHFLI